jgi:hypothetical protein
MEYQTMFKAIKKRIWPEAPPASGDIIIDDHTDDMFDKGVRNCPYNQVRLGIIGNWWHFTSYWKILRSIEYMRLLEAIWELIQFTLVFVLLPIAPFIRAYFMWRDAAIATWVQLANKYRADHRVYYMCLAEEATITQEWKFNQRAHVFYKESDTDIHPAMQNQHGELVYAVCRICGQAEGELEATCPGNRDWRK